ncbi:DUF2849 domain-containing protein [Maricaulis salignorans]|uniref:DUF2849 domain-containing protein n=1 Tax=Maricaulis salignorans TaxID=144026 RepID=A0A1G9QSD0_9PROT|nr:DUF2849 domain-containing protein [Maricaulis salignorans]SDM13949.1 Protein of unknown function [Maricaulis salignorans]
MKAITANRLTDGRVIYRTAQGQWSTRFQDAQPLDDYAAETVLAQAGRESGIAVGPYLIELGEHAPAGQKWRREGIRIDGPTSGTIRLIEPANHDRAA